jgi:hypothetical protein
VKFFLIGAEIATLWQIQRGYFAMGHRVVIFLRSAAVGGFWVRHFADSASQTVFSVLFADPNSLVTARLYIVVKCVYLAQLIWDLDSVRGDFLSAWAKFVANDGGAVECAKGHCEGGIRLRCGHSACRECFAQQCARAPFCPECGEPVMPTPEFAVFDGEIGLASLFCCI